MTVSNNDKMKKWLQERTQLNTYYTSCTRNNLSLFKKTARAFYAGKNLKVKITNTRPKDRRANVWVRLVVFQ